MVTSQQKITPLLTFMGQAEEALTFYMSLFDHAEIVSIRRYGPHEAGTEGSVMHATFTLSGQTFMCIDSPPVHDWTFTPAISLSVDCHTDEEIIRLTTALSQDGQVFMPLDTYPFARRFAWVSDRFGVSWQLMLDPTF